MRNAPTHDGSCLLASDSGPPVRLPQNKRRLRHLLAHKDSAFHLQRPGVVGGVSNQKPPQCQTRARQRRRDFERRNHAEYSARNPAAIVVCSSAGAQHLEFGISMGKTRGFTGFITRIRTPNHAKWSTQDVHTLHEIAARHGYPGNAGNSSSTPRSTPSCKCRQHVKCSRLSAAVYTSLNRTQKMG